MQLPINFMGGNIWKGSFTALLFVTGIASAIAAEANVGVLATGNPDLRITEVLPDQVSSPGVPGGDWWELTSFAPAPVDLSGWRFNDNTGDLVDPFVIPNGLVINPGESIIFADQTTPEEFISWWGAANLPQGLKIVNYSGTGLGLGATSGDGIRLWNATTTSATDVVAKVDFGAATQGVSFTYDPATGQFGGLSQVGVNGAFKAAATESLPEQDIGSPGRITGNVNPTQPQLTASRLENGQVRIQFASVAGSTYTLEQKPDITSAWTSTGTTLNATGTTSFFDVEASGTQRYFRVRVQ